MQTATERPETEAAHLHEWTVLLEFAGLTVYAWQGYAANSINASDCAKRAYFDRSIFSEQQLLGLRVKTCSQVNV